MEKKRMTRAQRMLNMVRSETANPGDQSQNDMPKHLEEALTHDIIILGPESPRSPYNVEPPPNDVEIETLKSVSFETVENFDVTTFELVDQVDLMDVNMTESFTILKEVNEGLTDLEIGLTNFDPIIGGNSTSDSLEMGIEDMAESKDKEPMEASGEQDILGENGTNDEIRTDENILRVEVNKEVGAEVQNDDNGNNNMPLTEINGNQSKRNIKKKKNKLSRKDKAKLKSKEKHPMRDACKDTCSKKCKTSIPQTQRSTLHEKFWSLPWIEQRSFILNSCSRIPVKRRTAGTHSQRNFTFIFRLKQNDGKLVGVCKTFFLATLGYHRKNDKAVFNVLHKSLAGAITAEKDKRGESSPPNKIDRNTILAHVDTFHPNISHYRREHAPRVRYIPNDISISFMHKDFLQKYPQNKCSYEAYRKILYHENIRFTKLGHEECEACEIMEIHDPSHRKETPSPECDQCQKWTKHIEKANIARTLYRTQAKLDYDSTTLCVSADLEKIIMLPRMEHFKKVLFTPRIIVYNETFVPLGIKSTKTFPVAVIWHEAIAGRGKEEIISTFHQFILQNRDIKKFIFWLDNCAAQNKNWAFMSYLVYIVNSNKVAAESIEVNYFEPGHTFMSADSVHHQIELSLKRQKKTCDFSDFVNAVQKSNSGKISVKTMAYSDFFNFKDFSAPSKRNGRGNEKIFLADIVHIKADRGSFDLLYKCSFQNEETKSLNFLKKDVLKKKSFPEPAHLEGPCGISEEKKSSIIKNLLDLMDENRKEFWLNLPIKQ